MIKGIGSLILKVHFSISFSFTFEVCEDLKYLCPSNHIQDCLQ